MSASALEAAFGEADPDHFDWQTRASIVADQERALIARAFLPLGSRVLDLGCGEGATLYHLGEPEGATGIDLFQAKVEFARERLPRCRFVCGSVYELPFDAGSFDHLLIRDVVHHVEQPSRLFDECARVLVPGGRIDVLEPCRYNPLIALHALANRAERGELRSTESFLRREVSRRFQVITCERYQPFPIHRLVLHPTIGRPELARHAIVRRTLAAAEELAGRVVPRFAWAYLHVRAALG